MKAFWAVALLSAVASNGSQTPPPPRYQPALDDAFNHLYSSDFDGAQKKLDAYLGDHPDDPVAYAIKASGYLFSELHRLGILESQFFQDDRAISDKKKHLTPDPATRDHFYAAQKKVQELAGRQLAANPNDVNALFAQCLANGDLTDYTALIEKHQMQSLTINRDGYRDAKRLLQVAPDFYDAKLTTGFTEYLIGSMPIVFRWFVRFDDVHGDKREGMQILETVADKGHYLKPFAKILLATAYLREKDYKDARLILVQLTERYPQNQLLKRELDRLSSRL